MQAMSYTAVRERLAQTMQKVCKDHDPVIITRKNNSSVVMLSLEDYESLNETNYLLSGRNNARRLIDSIDELNAGSGKERNLAE